MVVLCIARLILVTESSMHSFVHCPPPFSPNLPLHTSIHFHPVFLYPRSFTLLLFLILRSNLYIVYLHAHTHTHTHKHTHTHTHSYTHIHTHILLLKYLTYESRLACGSSGKQAKKFLPSFLQFMLASVASVGASLGAMSP